MDSLSHSQTNQQVQDSRFESSLQFYYSDPRFSMTVLGRLLVRVFSVLISIILLVFVFMFLFERSIPFVQMIAVFILLFFIDLFVHRGQADRNFLHLGQSGRVNLASFVTPSAYTFLERSFDQVRVTGIPFPLLLMQQLLSHSAIITVLERLDVDPNQFRQKLIDFQKRNDTHKVLPQEVRGVLEQVVVLAGQSALSAHRYFITETDLFAALDRLKDPVLQKIFTIFDVSETDIVQACLFSTSGKPRSFFVSSSRGLEHHVVNRAWTSRTTPTLDQFGSDLTDLARSGYVGFMIGHKKEYERLVDVLSRPQSPNVLLVGEAGVGKSTLVAHLAYDIVRDKTPDVLFDRRLVQLEIGSLVASASSSDLAGRIQALTQEILTSDNIILFIPDIHNLIKAGGEAFLSAADALLPIIKNGSFPVIGTTYPAEFKQYLEGRSDFVGSFEVLPVQEISLDEAQQFLTYEALALEQQTKLTITFSAVKQAVLVAKKYFHNRPLPGNALDILKEAVVAVSRRGAKVVHGTDVTVAAEQKTNIPIRDADAGESDRLLHLEDLIHNQFVDQEEAVSAVSQALREYRSGLIRRGGPIATFLFVGPTGVGKTELAKVLTQLQFGNAEAMIRFDMSEYKDKDSLYRFIGTPDGKTRGELTEAVLQKPYSLILLDEFEKADTQILDLFLSVFDDGRLTDNLARVIDFTNTIIIATSNAHSDIINDALSKGQSMTQIADFLKKKLVDVFRAELINRFSRIVVFRDLTPKHLEAVARIQLLGFGKLLEEQGISFSFDDSAVTALAKLGYDPAFGARPLRRVIDEQLRSPLATKLLSREIIRGSSVVLRYDGASFVFDSQ